MRRRLATAGEDGTARVWDVTPGGSREWLTLSGYPAGVSSVKFSADGRQLVTTGDVASVGDRMQRVIVWNARTGAAESSHLQTFDVGLPGRFSPEGRIHTFVPSASTADGTVTADAATDENGTSNGAVNLMDATTGDVLRTLPARHVGVQAIEFDSSGKLIATGNWDGTAVVWDVASGRALHTFAAHNGFVEAVAFSPDDRLLATGGDDTTTGVWDLKTGKRLLTLRGHTRAITDLAFSPDGTRLGTASLDGTVRVYVLPIDTLMRLSRSRLTRGWTREECARYLPGGRCPRQA